MKSCEPPSISLTTLTRYALTWVQNASAAL
jgi:hypothetical protein